MTDAATSPMPIPTATLPTEGETRLRVRYCECDPQGVAHHGSYAAWLEEARTDLLRMGGIRYGDMEAAGRFLVVARMDLRYRAPARYDDDLVVVARVTGGGRARIDHGYEVWRDTGDGRGRSVLLAEATTTLACVDRTGRPTALPDWLRPVV